MNKFTQALVAAAFTLAACGQAVAAFTLNGTRFIYEEGKKNISFEVTNNADQTYGGQVWIENSDARNSAVYLVPQPPFFKVDGRNKQIVRILMVDESLPKERESLFWLNVQEVPPKPADKEGNVLAIAMNTKVKLFYRPQAIAAGRQDAEKQLQVEQRGNTTWLKNPTPYYMAIASVSSNGREVKLPASAVSAISTLAPFSEVSLGTSVSGKISVSAVNDWGGVQSWTLNG